MTTKRILAAVGISLTLAASWLECVVDLSVPSYTPAVSSPRRTPGWDRKHGTPSARHCCARQCASSPGPLPIAHLHGSVRGRYPSGDVPLRRPDHQSQPGVVSKEVGVA